MNMMNNIITTILLIGTGLSSMANTPELPGMMVKDTVIIHFGNKSKIMILVDDPEELKKISEFDLNKMLRDLSISVDTLDDRQQYLKIEDENGEKYLNDTSIVVNRAHEIDIDALKEEIKEDLRDEMREDEWRDNDRRRRYNSKTRSYFNFEFGMNNWLENGKYPNETNALYTVRNWGSWYVSLANTNRAHITGPLYLDFGANISWYNFKFQNDRARMVKGPDNIEFYEDLLVSNPIKSKLTISYINATLVPVFSFGRSGRKRDLFNWDYYDKGLRIGIGGYVGYRLWSFTKYTWREDGTKNKNHNKDDYYLNNLRYGLKFVMGIRVVDIFVNYDLNTLFIENKGPKLNALTFGIVL